MSEKTGLENIEMPKNFAEAWESSSKPNLYLTEKDLERGQKALAEPSEVSLNSLSEIWEVLKEDIMTRTDTPKHPIGLRSLDDLLWGVHKKELMVVGARTSQGKSAFSIFLAKQLADIGRRVIYFSLEMSKEQILERIFTQLTLINNVDLRKGYAKPKVVEREKILIDWMEDAKLLIDDRYGYDFDKLVSIVEIIKPDFVFIDYIQMVSTKGFKSKLEAIEEYVRKIKELSIRKDFGVILLSQVNRSGTEGAEMQHLKWAGVLEEHADSVVMLKWDWSIEDPNKYIVDVKKQRHAPVKNGIMIDFMPEFSLFKEKIMTSKDMGL